MTTYILPPRHDEPSPRWDDKAWEGPACDRLGELVFWMMRYYPNAPSDMMFDDVNSVYWMTFVGLT